MSRISETRRLMRQVARAPGWTAHKTRNGHWCALGPNGARVYTSSTPSDVRAVHNFLARLRRAGLDLRRT